MSEHIVVKNDGAVRVIRMNRPEKKNALTQPMYAAMTEALREAAANEAIRCVMIAGGERVLRRRRYRRFSKARRRRTRTSYRRLPAGLGKNSEAAGRRGQWPGGGHRYHHVVSLRSCRRLDRRRVHDAVHKARPHS